MKKVSKKKIKVKSKAYHQKIANASVHLNDFAEEISVGVNGYIASTLLESDLYIDPLLLKKSFIEAITKIVNGKKFNSNITSLIQTLTSDLKYWREENERQEELKSLFKIKQNKKDQFIKSLNKEQKKLYKEIL